MLRYLKIDLENGLYSGVMVDHDNRYILDSDGVPTEDDGIISVMFDGSKTGLLKAISSVLIVSNSVDKDIIIIGDPVTSSAVNELNGGDLDTNIMTNHRSAVLDLDNMFDIDTVITVPTFVHLSHPDLYGKLGELGFILNDPDGSYSCIRHVICLMVVIEEMTKVVEVNKTAKRLDEVQNEYIEMVDTNINLGVHNGSKLW